jgi:hypothetical protein
MGRLAWFRRYRYDPAAVRCEDQELLFRALPDSTYANLPEILLGYGEPGLELRKILLSRWTWLKRSAGRSRGIQSVPGLASLAVMTGLKAGLDCVAVLTGLEQKLTRQRARSVSPGEVEEWNSVWKMTRERS